jgi:hypothetical protein
METTVAGTLPREVMAQGLLPRTLDDLRAFVGLAAKTAKPTVDVSVKINELFTQISEVADALFIAAIEQRTASEFRNTARSVFSDYVHVMRAKSDLLRVILRNDIDRTERLVSQSLSELEADFREQGMQRFGAAVNDQAVFTVWILRKTASHIWKLREPAIVGTPISPEDQQAQDALNSEFALYSAWAQFHLGCLNAAIRLNKAIYPDVLPAIMEGLRAMVDANAYARQIVELRIPSTNDTDLAPYSWDEEDNDLLQSSMRDIERDEL